MVKKPFFSNFFLFVILLFAVSETFKNKRWETLSIIQHDVTNYYSYLPATFIYHDLSFNFVQNLPKDIKNKISTPLTKEKRIFQKMTLGEAMLLLPFFYSAHIYSIINNLPATGYTPVYELSIALAALFYFAIGLIFLRTSLKTFFDDKVVAFTLLVIALATNLFYYATYESGASHVYSFCLFSIFLWLSIRWHKSTTVSNSVLLGLVIGLIALVRPSNCVVIVFFILYGVTGKKSFFNKFLYLKEKWPQLIFISMVSFFPLALQLAYWKFATGYWVYYSYGTECFYFNNPNIWKGLFGFRKGFFIYSPIMIFILPGIWLLFKQSVKYWFGLVVFFFINIYVIFSWHCWWYGGSFGSRPIVDSYALLALPLAIFISTCFQNRGLKKIMTIVFIGLFIKLNLFQIEQAKIALLHYDSMNAKVYFKIFGKKIFPENYAIMLSPPDNENAKKGLPERDIFNAAISNLTLLYSHKVTIRASNNKFMCADESKDKMILCNRDNPYEWETFIMSRYVGKICTIQSFRNKYLGVDISLWNKVCAKKDYPEQTELFRIVDLKNNQFALKAYDGTFIGLDKKQFGELLSGSSQIAKSETFILGMK